MIGVTIDDITECMKQIERADKDTLSEVWKDEIYKILGLIFARMITSNVRTLGEL